MSQDKEGLGTERDESLEVLTKKAEAGMLKPKLN